jgi:asparagine synthase (glutamine-hydrolysing)
MCGYVAIINNLYPVDSDELKCRIKRISYRGPNDEGVWLSNDRRVGFASCRLAIHDLSSDGHMPMTDASGDVVVAFNGEIYNFQTLRRDLESLRYSFRSRSDTEVLLNAYIEWGENCLERLEGMFSFVIYDNRSEISTGGKIFLARDRAGEKPLYYKKNSDGLIIASELKALLLDSKIGPIIDPDAFNSYLALGYVPREQCILKGYNKLPAGHAAVFDLDRGHFRSWRYWNLPKAWDGRRTDCEADGFISDLVQELKHRLLTSVSSRLLSDVPVGILLSGGLDSGLITAAAAQVTSGTIKTFTVAFPGSSDFDEGPQARLISNHFCTEHVEITVEDEFSSLIPMLAMQLDEPIGDASIVPTYIVSREARKHVTVALGGDGGDELFGGYSTYSRAIKLHDSLRRRSTSLPRTLIANLTGTMLPPYVRGRNFLASIGGEPVEHFVRYSMMLDHAARKQILSPEYLSQLTRGINGPERFRSDLFAHANGDFATRMMMTDFGSYLVDDVLMKVDRASMACSLETRAPWLDSGLIEFAYSAVPSKLKVTAEHRKILLKHLASEMLPANFDMSRKRGFSMPRTMWRSKKWGVLARETLLSAPVGVFNRPAISRFIRSAENNEVAASYLFPLVMFELWRRKCGASF